MTCHTDATTYSAWYILAVAGGALLLLLGFVLVVILTDRWLSR